MSRPKKNNYDSAIVMDDLLNTVVSAYNVSAKPSLQTIADELAINPIKVRKLLITAGVYESPVADTVLNLRRQNKSVPEIMSATGLSRASVNSYLPYTKIPYKANEISATAERIRRYRQRERAVEALVRDKSLDNLWKAMVIFEGYPFYTAKKLKFTYRIKGNEMFVDRKEKSITRATVELAFDRALTLGTDVTGPKKLRCFGASYLYPVFIRLGVIQVRVG